MKKSKAILYHVDISRRYFFVCQLKIVFFFLNELIQSKGVVTGGLFSCNWGSKNDSKLSSEIQARIRGDHDDVLLMLASEI